MTDPDIQAASDCIQSVIDQRDALAARQSAAAAAIELAYGLLWHVGCNRITRDGRAIYLARQTLLAQLDKAGQERGINAAKAAERANG